MKWTVYILLCDQKTFYVGMTSSLEKRLNEHQHGQSPYTKKFSDTRLVYREDHVLRVEAERREAQLKKWSIAKKRALISGNFQQLRKLSKGREVGDDSAGRT